jgi:predicted ATPase
VLVHQKCIIAQNAPEIREAKGKHFVFQRKGITLPKFYNKMTEKGKIKSISLQNFTCFEQIHLDFSSGINVFIGENGTGKTHVLKMMYAVNLVAANFEYEQNGNANGNGKVAVKPHAIVNTPLEVFSINLEELPELIKFEKTEADVNAEFNDKLFFGYKMTAQSMTPNVTLSDQTILDPVFIPTHDMLATYRGFIPYYLQYENDYDKTHFDLAVNLQKPNLKVQPTELLQAIQDKTGIDVQLNNDGLFYITDGKVPFKAKLAAEGIRKIAQIIQLIKNGTIKKHSILYWDEPEVNLNPKYIRLVADFLMVLAKNGVQIFIATHDYLLAHYLSTKAEYQNTTHAPDMAFFAFNKTANGTEVESAANLTGIQNNVLLDEYAALYDLESELFRKSATND